MYGNVWKARQSERSRFFGKLEDNFMPADSRTRVAYLKHLKITYTLAFVLLSLTSLANTWQIHESIKIQKYTI